MYEEVAPGLPILEIARINARSPGGPRYDSSFTEVDGSDNLIVLCPSHHRLVDAEAHRYTVETLRRYKNIHALTLEAEKSQASASADAKLLPMFERHSFAEALKVWKEKSAIGSEEYWHKFFAANPQIIALAMPNHVLQIGDKCYVGGKTWQNVGGNVVDFLYANQGTRNVTLVEIKPPTMALIGGKYRAGVFGPSVQLAGSVVQVFNYRNSILKDFYSLARERPFEALNPHCLIVAGNLEASSMSAEQRSSFDLFRYGLSQCAVVTYDELFAKVYDVIELWNEQVGAGGS